MARTGRSPVCMLLDGRVIVGRRITLADLVLTDPQGSLAAELDMLRLLRCFRVCVVLWWADPARWGTAAHLLAAGFAGTARELIIVVEGIAGHVDVRE